MHIGILTLTFTLPGCSSLKEKRQRMGGLHERIGRNPAIAVCESGELDRHDASEWTFIVVATSKRKVESLCNEIEERVQRVVDARIMDVVREFI
ncbi:DUF503 domain-containing protein [Psychrobacter sp. M13]|uniref:DUF503 domain-containing protein n=1 Tax=Psychrobacter sp. M13 TaxID=3067275 RepID=UPI00273C1F96|nr:DUF503 domain-containing protein [Psychrobacter sp. M13]WLP94636.1 DUF503 domain-containing protein [Psychrobacter sp. M13]